MPNSEDTGDASAPDTSAEAARPPRGRGRVGNRAPEIEIALGARIRAARIAARMSQAALGAAVGVSFQQVQKYELGKDRVAASTLQGLAAALGVHPGSFFGADMPLPTGRLPEVHGAMAVAARWQRIKSPELRKRLASLIATMADEDAKDEAASED